MKVKDFEKMIPDLPWKVRAFAKAQGQIYYNDRDVNERYGRYAEGYAVDLGTDGVAGHGYHTKPGDFRYFIEIESEKIVSIQNIQGNGWNGDGIDLKKIGSIHYASWIQPTKCGCI